MENLTSDLPGVAVFQDDMLVSGQDANDHLSNLKRLLTRLNDKGLSCRRDKCQFAQPSVEYLGHTLSAEGISKGSKVEAVLKMAPPTDISSLKSFLGSVQFYGKFIPNLASMAEPLYRLTKKTTPWKWEEEEQATFEQLKNVLSSDQVLVHFDPNKTLVLAFDASNVGIGAVLVHRLEGWKQASNCQHVQDSHCCRKKLQSNPQGSAVHHIEGSRPERCVSSMIYSRDTPFWSGTLDIWPEEVVPVPLRTPVHAGDRSQATDSTVRSKERDATSSS